MGFWGKGVSSVFIAKKIQLGSIKSYYIVLEGLVHGYVVDNAWSSLLSLLFCCPPLLPSGRWNL